MSFKRGGQSLRREMYYLLSEWGKSYEVEKKRNNISKNLGGIYDQNQVL